MSGEGALFTISVTLMGQEDLDEKGKIENGGVIPAIQVVKSYNFQLTDMFAEKLQ
jgi:hypothetical protein